MCQRWWLMTPPFYKRLRRLGGPPAAARRLPAWRRNPIGEQIADRPLVVRDARRHRRRDLEGSMHRTEIVHRPNQIHLGLSGKGTSTDGTALAAPTAVMDPEIPLRGLASCRTGGIGRK